ncbi:DUF4827 domain-containing protein [Bacteroidales bacterium OttesenSCG-928-M11]|nr:DUF4827 domain-containing protein [Bacteroidales bacterium OttesenSCG-928-M11]
MKKSIVLIVSFALLFILLPACSKSKSAQEMLRDEQKAVDRFVDREGFKTTTKYPSNGVFKENEYYLTNSGLYINVVDSGNGKRASLYKTDVTVRFDYSYDIAGYVSGDESAKFSPDPYYQLPYEFSYGISSTYTHPACVGWAEVLEHVGEGAIVNLIVPSKIGSSSDRTYYVARYYKNLQYTRFY